MPAITITDLNNAKIDVDHIAAIATSTQNTATDRLGTQKKTLKGFLNDATLAVNAQVIASVQSVQAQGTASVLAIQTQQNQAVASVLQQASQAVEDVEAQGLVSIVATQAQATNAINAINNTVSNTQSSANAILASLGYIPPVAYTSGLVMDAANKTVSFNGDVYAPKVADIPFTTSGTFETAKFRLIQGLTGSDLAANTGSSLMGYREGSSGSTNQTQEAKNRQVIDLRDYGVTTGNTIAGLVGKTPTLAYTRIFITSYHNGWAASATGRPTGGRNMVWNPSCPKNLHDGGTIISPTVPWNGTVGTLAAFLAGTGETDPGGSGCWVNEDSKISPMLFGAVAGGGTSAADVPAIQKAIDIGSLLKRVVDFEGQDYYVNSEIRLKNNITLDFTNATIRLGTWLAAKPFPQKTGAFVTYSGSTFVTPSTATATENITLLTSNATFDGGFSQAAGLSTPNANSQGGFFIFGSWGDGTNGPLGWQNLRTSNVRVEGKATWKNFSGNALFFYNADEVNIEAGYFLNIYSNVSLSQGSGIALQGCQNVTLGDGIVCNHTSSGLSWHGMVILDFDQPAKNITVGAVRIRNMNNGDGISCEGNTLDNLMNATFNGPVIENVNGQGIGVDNCVSVVINGPFIDGAQVGGIVLTNTEKVVINGPIIQNCKGFGILGTGVLRSVLINGPIIDNVEFLADTANLRGFGIFLLSDAADSNLVVSVADVRNTDAAGIFLGNNVSGRGKISNCYVGNPGRGIASVSQALRSGIIADSTIKISDTTLEAGSGTFHGISSLASDAPSIKNITFNGDFGGDWFFMARRAGVAVNTGVSQLLLEYDADANILSYKLPAPPTSGYYFVGDKVIYVPTISGFEGAACVVTGSPGTWVRISGYLGS